MSPNEKATEAAEPTRRRGPQPDRGPAQLRAEMIEAGLIELQRSGLPGGFLPEGCIRFDDVVETVKAKRASAYRYWAWHQLAADGLRAPWDDATLPPPGPSENYRHELADSILRLTPGVAEHERSGVATVLMAIGEFPTAQKVASMSPDKRHKAMRAMIRRGAEANQLELSESTLWRTGIAIMAALSTRREAHPELSAAVEAGQRSIAIRYRRDLYEPLFCGLFGAELRPCYSWDQFGLAAAAVVEGIALRDGFAPQTRNIRRRTGPRGGPEEWTLFAVCFEALVRQFFQMPDGSDVLPP